MYTACESFTDVTAGRRVGYIPGDVYPKAGVYPDEEHIEYLLSDDTSFGHPVIQLEGTSAPTLGQEGVTENGAPSDPESTPQAEPEGTQPAGPESTPQAEPTPDKEGRRGRKKANN